MGPQWPERDTRDLARLGSSGVSQLAIDPPNLDHSFSVARRYSFWYTGGVRLCRVYQWCPCLTLSIAELPSVPCIFSLSGTSNQSGRGRLSQKVDADDISKITTEMCSHDQLQSVCGVAFTHFPGLHAESPENRATKMNPPLLFQVLFAFLLSAAQRLAWSCLKKQYGEQIT